jgi:hypothetical protein
MDIRHVVNATAVITLGKDMVWRDYAQGAYRMRGIGAGQQIRVIVIPEVRQLIRRELDAAGVLEPRAAAKAAAKAAAGDGDDDGAASRSPERRKSSGASAQGAMIASRPKPPGRKSSGASAVGGEAEPASPSLDEMMAGAAKSKLAKEVTCAGFTRLPSGWRHSCSGHR